MVLIVQRVLSVSFAQLSSNMSSLHSLLRKAQFVSHRSTGRIIAEFPSYYPGLNQSTKSKLQEVLQMVSQNISLVLGVCAKNGGVGVIHLSQEILSKDATAKEIQTLSYLFGDKTTVDGKLHIYITHVFLPDQTATANSSELINDKCLNDFEKQYKVTRMRFDAF